MKFSNSQWLSISAILGLLTVVIGAFGAHALRSHLAPHYYEVLQTGVQYQMFHTLAILGVSAFALNSSNLALNRVRLFFLIGTTLFSGSLYLLAVTEITWLGMITPFGGVSLILGWAALLWQAKKLN